MELFEIELEEAKKRLAKSGRSSDDFSFKITHLPPDPDEVAMFTARYAIAIASTKTGKSLQLIGGIGLDWVDDFQAALESGHFD
jgi:hypothetical protein